MNVKMAVATFGTDAVKKYRSMAAVIGETFIPEACLRLFIASSMITDCKWDARVEMSYVKILRELGVHGTEIIPKFGGQRADIAVYDKGAPSAIIEIKIIDEGRKLDGVVSDWQKITLLQRHLATRGLPNLPGYVGALVCDVERKLADQAVEDPAKALAVEPSAVDRGIKHTALSNGWEWRFVCAELA